MLNSFESVEVSITQVWLITLYKYVMHRFYDAGLFIGKIFKLQFQLQR
jgi:hypothetical protein